MTNIFIAKRDYDGSKMGINGAVRAIPLNTVFDADAATIEVLRNASVPFLQEPFDLGESGQIRISRNYRGPRFVVVNGVRENFPLDQWFTPSADALPIILSSPAGSDAYVGRGAAPVLTAIQRSRGEAMLASAISWTGRTYTASAPVMTLGAASVASTINGAAVGSPTYLMTDEAIFARTAPDAPLKANGSWGSLFSYSSTSGAQNTVGGQGPTYSFDAVNLTAFDLSCYSGGTLARAFRLRLDDDWAQEEDYVTASWGGGRRYIKFAPASPYTGRVSVSVETTLTILGMNIAATSVTAPDTTNDIKGEMWWDSYAVGGAAWTNSLWAAPARLFMEAFGVADPIPQGRASQGWVNLIDSRNILQRIGLDAGFAISDPHFSAMCNSVNDRDEDIPTVAANMALGVQALQTAYPDSWVPVIIGLDTAVDGFPAGALDAMWDACSAVADARTLMIDGRAWPKISMTGTLPNGEPHDSIDGVHPGPNERALLRTLVRAAYIAALQAALA